MQKTAALIGAGMLSLVTGPAMAQISPAGPDPRDQGGTSGQSEVALGGLAIEKTGSQQVRQFGQQMVSIGTRAITVAQKPMHQALLKPDHKA
jgi:hypothetical protein